MFVTRKRFDTLLQTFHTQQIELNRLCVELRHKDIEIATLTQLSAEMKEERNAERVRAELAVDRTLEQRGAGPISDPIRNTGHTLQDLLADGDAMHGEDPNALKDMLREIDEEGLSAVMERKATDERSTTEDD